MQITLPPAIRIFISSTFADMKGERQYFNTIIAPKLRKMCMQRGVSFFSVDLRWGITEEDQIQGNVMKICLREIDNCRPFFIGILGNRYGSIPDDIPLETVESFPWLIDQKGKSVTELEMYYGVLRTERERETPRCAFFFRSDHLSEQVYPEKESGDKLEKLNRLKAAIRAEEGIPVCDYDALDQFEQQILSAVSNWLDSLFPSVNSVYDARKDWYNRELLRDYVPLDSMQSFLDSYCRNSSHTLLVYGEASTGKTTALTAWTPSDGQKILINCGADEEYQYWPAIAFEIVNQLKKLDEKLDYPEFKAYASLYFRMREGLQQEEERREAPYRTNHSMYFVTDEDLESFRKGFVVWLSKVTLQVPVYIVINDLDLLSDTKAAFLNWLPAETRESIHLICSANDDTILDNAQAMGWNTKEMPLLSRENALRFMETYMAVFGKKLSAIQLASLENTPLLMYPGHQKRIVQFFNNYGSFENLDELTDAVGQMKTEEDLDRFMLDRMISALSPQEAISVQNAFFILTETSLSLQENDLYRLVQELSPIDAIGWARIRIILEQFQLITADSWKIWNKTIREIVSRFPVDSKRIHRLLGRFFFDQMDEKAAGTSEGIKHNTECAKAALYHYALAEDWETLTDLLQDWMILYYLSKMEWAVIRSMWMRLLMFSDLDVAEKLKEIFSQCDRKYGGIEGIHYRIICLMSDLEQWDAASWASAQSGLQPVSSLGYISPDTFSENNGQIYNRFVELKKQRQFLDLLKSVNAFLKENEACLTSEEKCNFFFLKQDAEMQTGNFQSALATVYKFYSAAIAASNDYELLRAALSRGEILYFQSRYTETEEALRYVQKLALNLGSIREYLASRNIEGMCNYRQKRFEEAITCFNSCMKSWKRLGNNQEYANCWLNRTNTYMLSGDLKEAVRDLESLVQFLRSCPEHGRLAFLEAKVLGNLARAYDDQGRAEEAEAAYIQSLASSQGRSDTTSVAYYGLIQNYLKRNLFTKAIDVYQKLIDFLYQRSRYSELETAINECVELMYKCKFSFQAKEMQKKWEEILNQIPDVHPHLHKVPAEASDQQLENQLREQLVVAKSEKDYEKCGNLLFVLADLADDRKDREACNLYIEAIAAFSAAGNRKRAEESARIVTGLLINSGMDDPFPDRVCEMLSSEDKAVAALWLRLRDESFSDMEYTQELRQIMMQSSPDQPLAGQCLISEAEHMMEKAPEDLLVQAVEWMKAGGQYDVFRNVIFQAATKDFSENFDFLRRNYTGERVHHLMEQIEKSITVLDAIGSVDAGAMAGNIALIYRRQKNQEQTFRHHEQAIRIYRNHNKRRDMFIEEMNLATAYQEFEMPDKALNQLRSLMKDPDLEKYPDMRASIAGNMAAELIRLDNNDAKEEILACFAIEESYFEKAGEKRELVISLINQLNYAVSNSTMKLEEMREKYLRVEELTKKYQMNEFGQVLRSLRPSIMGQLEKASEKKTGFARIMDIFNNGSKSKKNNISPRRVLDMLAGKDSSFTVAEIDEETETGLHALLYPQKTFPLMIFNIHLWITCGEDIEVKYLFAVQPTVLQGDAELAIKQYINWWNEQNDYEILLDRQENELVILTTSENRSSDCNDLVDEFMRIEVLWLMDMLCFTMCVLGHTNLKELQELKQSSLKRP